MAMIISCGEALVDLVPAPVPGGGPMNVAVTCARLGAPTAFVGRVSTDSHGEAIWEHLVTSGVDVRLTQRGPEPTCRAEVFGDPPVFRFHGEHTADVFVEPPDPALLIGGPHLLHGGTLSIFREPGAGVLAELAESLDGIVSFDPNVRPQIIEPLGRARWQPWFDRWCAVASLFRASDDDLAWIWPDRDKDDIAAELLARGIVVLITTRSVDVTVHTAQGHITVPVPPVEVVDTVGAGDSFCGGVLTQLWERHIHTVGALATVTLREWREIVTFAISVAGIKVRRQGADPPFVGDLST